MGRVWLRLAGAVLVLAVFQAVLSSPAVSDAWTPASARDLHQAARDSVAFIAAGDFARALPPTRQLVQLFPAQHVYHARLARIYHELGQRDEEALAWAEVMRTSATPWDACPAIADAYRAAGRHDETLEALQQCHDVAPWAPDLSFYLAREYEGRADTAAAMRWYTATVEIAPDHVDSQLGLARIALRQGRAAEARRIAESVLASSPDHADALLTAGTSAHELGDAAAARSHLERALALAPAYVDAHIALGILEFAERRVEVARRHFERVVELEPARRAAVAVWLQRTGSTR